MAGKAGRYTIQVIVAIQHLNRDEAVAEVRRRLAEWMMEDVDALGRAPLAGSLLHYAVLAPRGVGHVDYEKDDDRLRPLGHDSSER